MFQENPLQSQHAVKIQFYEALSSQVILTWSSLFAYLISCSDDKHPSQDEALAVHVALIPGPPGSDEVLPHPETKEPQTPHLPLQRAVEVFLQSHGLVLVSLVMRDELSSCFIISHYDSFKLLYHLICHLSSCAPSR